MNLFYPALRASRAQSDEHGMKMLDGEDRQGRGRRLPAVAKQGADIPGLQLRGKPAVEIERPVLDRAVPVLPVSRQSRNVLFPAK